MCNEGMSLFLFCVLGDLFSLDGAYRAGIADRRERAAPESGGPLTSCCSKRGVPWGWQRGALGEA